MPFAWNGELFVWKRVSPMNDHKYSGPVNEYGNATGFGKQEVIQNIQGGKSVGFVYWGEFDRGMKINGVGYYTFRGDSAGVGEWVNGKLNGVAIITYEDGAEQQANFVDGEPDGYGEYIFPDGRSRFEGIYRAGTAAGRSLLIEVDDGGTERISVGTWVNGEMESESSAGASLRSEGTFACKIGDPQVAQENSRRPVRSSSRRYGCSTRKTPQK
jgi:hypothetical protein